MDLITMYLHSDKIQQKIKDAVENANRRTQPGYSKVHLGLQAPLMPCCGDIWINTATGGAKYFNGDNFIAVMADSAVEAKAQDASAMEMLTAMETVNRNDRRYERSVLKDVSSFIESAAKLVQPSPAFAMDFRSLGIPAISDGYALNQDNVMNHAGARRSRVVRGQSI